MRINAPKLLALSVLGTALLSFTASVSAASVKPLVDFEFNEGSGTKVTDSIASLVGTPGDPSKPPTFVTDSPSGKAGDTAVHFEDGQYFQVNDPSTQIKFDAANPDFTLQAWVKFDGNPAGRQVFFYNNGAGGALSFSINTDRTIFVTTLGIKDQSSTAAIPDDGKWHHIAVVHQNGVQFTFYVDGVLADTEAYTSGVLINRANAQTLFSIGAEWNGALQFIGSVDRLKITSGLLNADQLDYQAIPPATLVDFEFNEGTGTKVTDSVASLVGTPGDAANPPTFVTDSPSGQGGDTAVHFETGQYFQVNDPSTQIKFDTNNPNFTLQAWVKFDGNPSGEQVFFYNNGAGGALSFSINTDRTVFVTTLGIKDQSSTAAIPDDGKWHHIAVIHQNGVQFTFYVDGVLADTEAYTGGVLINRANAQTLFSIGAEWNGALQFIGSVDRLKITSGILSADQLDSQPIPPAGTAGLAFANPTGSPLGFSLAVNEVGGTVTDTNTIALTLNGNAVNPSSVTRSSSTSTLISYTVPGAPLLSGSSNAIKLTIKDTKGVSYTDTANFVVGTFGTLPANAAVAADTTKKGFKIKTYQIDGPSTTGTVGTIAYNEALLAGQLGPNVATVPDPVAGNVDSNGYYSWTNVINFDVDISANEGYFNDPDYPKSSFPGIPGNASTGGVNENFAEEILASLQFPAPGMYTMAVNTDWTGFPDSDDGFQVRAGANPTNSASSVVLGFFDASAPVGPTRGVADSPFQFYVPQAGSYPFRLFYYQSTTGAQLEWYMVNPDGTRTLINDSTKANSIAAYSQWTAAAAAPTLSLDRTTTGVTLTFTGSIQSADSVLGPWTDQAVSSPLSVQTTAPMKFYRARQ